jgi:hypothetical protein
MNSTGPVVDKQHATQTLNAKGNGGAPEETLPDSTGEFSPAVARLALRRGR